MHVRCFSALCVWLTLATQSTICLATDGPREPELGPAEPIGALLLVSSVEEIPQRLPTPVFPLPIEVSNVPILGTPVLLASLISTESEAIPLPVSLHPDEIQQPLRDVVERLASVGLNGESQQIQDILTKFERQHAQRLLLQRKEAELAVLQAEVVKLKQAACNDQICLRIKVMERTVKTDSTHIGDTKSAETPNRRKSMTRVIDSAEFDRWIAEAESDVSWKTLSVPTITLLSGQTGQFSSGGEFKVPKELRAQFPNPIEFGTFLSATATLLDSDQLRVAIELEQKQLDHANAVNGIPGVSRRRVQSTVELRDGQTIVLGGLISSRTDTETKLTDETESVITVTAELVQPMPGDVSAIPASYEAKPQVQAPLPSVK